MWLANILLLGELKAHAIQMANVDTWSQAFLASSLRDWGFYKGYEYEYFQAQNLMMMMMMMRGGWDTLHQTLIYGRTEKNEYSSNKT